MELFGTTTIMDVADAMVTVFVPIFLYTSGFSLIQIIEFFTVVYIIYFFVVPLGGKLVKSRGFEHCILYSSFFTIFYYLFLFAVSYSHFFIVGVAIMLVLAKTFYWPAYHCDFAFYGGTKSYGRGLGARSVFTSIVSIIGPVAGGIITQVWGFKLLFIVVVVLYFASHIFTFSTLEKFQPEPFSYSRAIKRVFRQKNRKKFFSFLGFGEEFIGLCFWPLFVYAIVDNYTDIGLIFGGSALALSFATLYIGRLTDKTDKKALLKTGTYIYSLLWLIRLFIRGGLGVFLVESVSSIGRRLVNTPQMAIIYQRAKAGKTVKKIVFFEMSLIIGKVLAGILLAAAFYLFGETMMFWQSTFVLAALFSLLYSLL